jgi:hypothetical protein
VTRWPAARIVLRQGARVVLDNRVATRNPDRSRPRAGLHNSAEPATAKPSLVDSFIALA